MPSHGTLPAGLQLRRGRFPDLDRRRDLHKRLHRATVRRHGRRRVRPPVCARAGSVAPVDGARPVGPPARGGGPASSHPPVTGPFAAVFALSEVLTVAVSGITATVVYFLFEGPVGASRTVHTCAGKPQWATQSSPTLVLISTPSSWRSETPERVLDADAPGSQVSDRRRRKGHLGRALVLVAATIVLWSLRLTQRLVIVRRWMRSIVCGGGVSEGYRALSEMLRFGLTLTPAGLPGGACDQIGTFVLGSVSPVAAVRAYSRPWFLGQRLPNAHWSLSELLFHTLAERRGTSDRVGHDRTLIDCMRSAALVNQLVDEANRGSIAGGEAQRRRATHQ